MESVQQRIIEKKLQNQITILSRLSDVEVRCAYRLSSLFVFPSYYEGFGIPILEAMASGIPIALSDIPVFREITQNSGLYFDPFNIESMCDAIEQGLMSTGLRKDIVEYGNHRVDDFEFSLLAAQLSAVYESINK